MLDMEDANKADLDSPSSTMAEKSRISYVLNEN
jgi:hypothetical protein